MSTQKTILMVNGPVLSGTLSQVSSKCGKSQCCCHSGKASDLHGPYYRWSGYINGRLTHRTLTKEVMRECKRRVANYHELQHQLTKILEEAIQNAPWLDAKNPKRLKL